MRSLVIPGPLPSLNDVIAANRTSPYVGARQKRSVQQTIGWAIKAAKLPAIEGRVDLVITWYEPDRRRDPDNVHSAVKFILDALVDAQVLAGDRQRHIGSIHHNPIEIDRRNPCVVVEFEESECSN